MRRCSADFHQTFDSEVSTLVARLHIWALYFQINWILDAYAATVKNKATVGRPSIAGQPSHEGYMRPNRERSQPNHPKPKSAALMRSPRTACPGASDRDTDHPNCSVSISWNGAQGTQTGNRPMMPCKHNEIPNWKLFLLLSLPLAESNNPICAACQNWRSLTVVGGALATVMNHLLLKTN